MYITELQPIPGTQKSFYGKASVKHYPDRQVLISYDSPIVSKDNNGNLFRLADVSCWSATTGRHVEAFCGLNKVSWAALPMPQKDIDIDKITDQVCRVLDANDVPFKTNIVRDCIISKWLQEKLPLINLLRKHPNWNEDCMALVWEHDYERELDRNTFWSANSDIFDYLLNVLLRNVNSFVRPIWRDKHTCHNGRREFGAAPDDVPFRYNEPDFYTSWDYADIKAFVREDTGEVIPLPFPWHLYEMDISPYVDEQFKDLFAECGVDVAVGTRTSRAFAKYFRQFDFSNWKDFNGKSVFEATFARLADSLSPMTVKRHTVLSLHPCDYLLMSNGNSWQSCHKIGHEYCAGTWSYMLDDVSMVLYTVDANFENTHNDIYNQPKIMRQMFFYQNGLLHQSRLYPQSSDACRATNDTFRNLVQGIISCCEGVPNLWTLKRDAAARKYCSSGKGSCQYPDYNYEYSGLATTSLLKNIADPEALLVIGAPPICPVLGREYDITDQMNISVCKCDKCGELVDVDDVIYREGYGDVCSDCAEDLRRCDCCCGWDDIADLTETANGKTVCRDCLERYYFICDCCGEWVRITDRVEKDGGSELCSAFHMDLEDTEDEEAAYVPCQSERENEVVCHA